MNATANAGAAVYLNGLGLGSIAAAMYLIQKADFNPSNIHIFEQMGDKQLVGGSRCPRCWRCAGLAPRRPNARAQRRPCRP